MTKLEWLESKTKNGFFKATFKQSFINAARVEAMKMGAIQINDNQTWTKDGKGYDMLSTNAKYKGGRGTIILTIFDLELNTDAAKNAESMVNAARENNMPHDQIRFFEKLLAEMINQRSV